MSYTFLRPKRMPKLYKQKFAGLFIALTALIAAPVIYAAGVLQALTLTATTTIALGAAGIALLVYALRGVGRRLGGLCIIALLSSCLLVRLTYLGLIQFSGAGFNTEFFLHLGGDSAVAAWHMFGLWLVVGFTAIGCYLLLSCTLALRLPRPRPLPALALILTTPFLIFSARAQLPEAELISASHTVLTPTPIPGYAQLRQHWQNSPLVETQITPKTQLHATQPDKPQNLILVYLESVGLPVISPPQWPGLMPNLEKLVASHSPVDSMYASSFITIEGIVNTQCGTLFPFDRGSDSLANGQQLGENMPCLADVLAHAGYQNYFLGGAGLDFAGKGNFLRAHGFNKPLGASYWQEQGLEPRPGTWGISDPDLFTQATNLIKQRQRDEQPYNLTLLTIGSHIPGFTYDECQPYDKNDNQFLNALHCTDQLLANWLDELSALGVLDDTTVIITADHHVFPNPQMKDLFGEAVYDRRVPFVVLKPEGAVQFNNSVGAGYDLAPTTLDLLGIDHNAKFSMGRSLVTTQDRPFHFINRYGDYVNNVLLSRSTGSCEQPEPAPGNLAAPISACQKHVLFNFLRRQVEHFSQQTQVASCEQGNSIAVRYISDDKQPYITVGGQSITSRLTLSGRPLPEKEKGLALIWLNSAGAIQNLQFEKTSKAIKKLGTIPTQEHTKAWLAVWNPGPGATESPPEWLPAKAGVASIHFGVKVGDDITWPINEAIEDAALNETWHLSASVCHNTFDLSETATSPE